MKQLKKIITLLIVLALLGISVFSLAACQSPITPEEAYQAMEDAIALSLEQRIYFWQEFKTYSVNQYARNKDGSYILDENGNTQLLYDGDGNVKTKEVNDRRDANVHGASERQVVNGKKTDTYVPVFTDADKRYVKDLKINAWENSYDIDSQQNLLKIEYFVGNFSPDKDALKADSTLKAKDVLLTVAPVLDENGKFTFNDDKSLKTKTTQTDMNANDFYFSDTFKPYLLESMLYELNLLTFDDMDFSVKKAASTKATVVHKLSFGVKASFFEKYNADPNNAGKTSIFQDCDRVAVEIVHGRISQILVYKAKDFGKLGKIDGEPYKLNITYLGPIINKTYSI